MSGDPSMLVTVHSTLRGKASGDISMFVNNEDTVDHAIIHFCIEKGVQYKSGYILRNNRNVILDKLKLITACGISNGDILYLGIKDTERTFGCNNWWILATVTLLIGGIGIIAVSLMYSLNTRVFDYGIIFDAGSSKTDMFIYKWDGAKVNNTGEVKEINKTTCSSQGVASLATDILKIKNYFSNCLNVAKYFIPKDHHRKSPLYLGATAGMRLLEKRNKSQSDAVMKAIQEEMNSSGFLFVNDQARIISGEEEGIGSWVTVNFLKGSLERDDENVDGALDLGGASTQITFEPRGKVEDVEVIRLYGKNHTVYSHSYLCYGKGEAERRMLANIVKNGTLSVVTCNCCPKDLSFNWSSSDLLEQVCTKSSFADKAWGFSIDSDSENEVYTFEGAGDFLKCQQEVNNLFNTSCNKSRCSFNNVFQPEITGDFIAFSGYYFVTQFFNVTVNTTKDQFFQKIEEFCGKSWKEINGTKVRTLSDLYYYCFDGLYVLKILELYGFNSTEMWNKLHFGSQINKHNFGWSLGFMLNATNTIPVETSTEIISQLTFIILAILFIVCIILAIIIACYARNHNRQTMELKPNYDYGTI